MNAYALAVIPPKNISEMVDFYRRKYAKYTSYVIVPHLTIIPPFYIQSGDEAEIIGVLEAGFKSTKPEKVVIEKIGYFEGKNNVAFFQPDSRSSAFLRDLLMKATNRLSGRVKDVYDDYSFAPEEFKFHMTIAEAIPGEQLPKIREELSSVVFRGSFLVSSVRLFRNSDDSNVWSELVEIKF
jgi:2'-5' RNA ligase